MTSGVRHQASGIRRGFTLVELIVVIGILGVVASVVGPAFLVRQAPNGGVGSEVVRLLERARQTAITTGRVTTVIIDPATMRAWVRTGGPPPVIDTTFTIDVPVDAKLTSTSARPRFTFDARGAASGEVLVIATTNANAVIRVDPWSGDVHATSSSNGAGRDDAR